MSGNELTRQRSSHGCLATFKIPLYQYRHPVKDSNPQSTPRYAQIEADKTKCERRTKEPRSLNHELFLVASHDSIGRSVGRSRFCRRAETRRRAAFVVYTNLLVSACIKRVSTCLCNTLCARACACYSSLMHPPRPSQSGEPFPSPPANFWCNGDSFNICDGRRATEDANVGGERRL